MHTKQRPHVMLLTAIMALSAFTHGSEWGTNRYIEYRAGQSRLVLSAPHGGDIAPATIPDRTYGTTVTDSWTREMTFRVQEILAQRRPQLTPHVVVCHLKRTKLDANRDIVEGAQGNAEAELAWTEYHHFITKARDTVQRSYGRGLYVDMHGHAHAEEWNEFGYLLTGSQLDILSDDKLNEQAIINQTSLRTLGNTGPIRFSDIIRGQYSMGAILESMGYKSVPSPKNPGPNSGSYFSGGYNTQVHGSLDGGNIDGMQLEMPASIRRTSEEIREKFCQDFATALEDFMEIHYG
eukprot:TRINITY_DN3876_c0_g1_i4.p1 TRINITY_DN3876_c0_g1~~TRINITY_DN3876_c0_g1_i4.p1  ORF type:complete len:293 (-),score=48.33 TRINITY_DN3876_c0_g1_i4:720-1598(-)